MEPHLSQRAGLFAFGHDFLRQAVETAFVPSGDLQQTAHLSVADYFERHTHQREMTPRKAAEWPHQLHAAQAWDRLEACLTDIPLFRALYNDKTQWELTGYWHPLRRLGCDMGGCYGWAYERWTAAPTNADDHYVPAQLGQFLSDNGLYAAAEPLLKRALGTRERVLGPEHPETLGSVNNLAALLYSKGDDAGAEPLYRRALEASERVLGSEHPSTLKSVNNLAALLARKGDYASAELLDRRALECFERVLGSEHPDTLGSVNNLAALLERKGDDAGAEPLYRRALEVRERVLGSEHPDPDTLVSVNNLAALLYHKGDDAGAEPLFRRALKGLLKISAKIGRPHPKLQTFIGNYQGCLEKQGHSREDVRNILEAMIRPLG